MTLRLAIHGATGRVGQRLIALAAADPRFTLVAAIASPTSPRLGLDAGDVAGVGPVDVAITTALPNSPVDCVIDFSTPAASLAIVGACATRGIPVVVATTGFEPEERERLLATASQTAVLVSPNTSLVVNLLFKLTELTGEALAGQGFDVEIIERHHRHKKDSPSGTATQFARIVQSTMQQTELRHGRHGLIGERPPHEIGIHAIRAGDNVGEHTILFSAPGESLELVHKGTSRDSYARGALLAAAYLAGKPAGEYQMKQVLGLK